jgi:hypothetical protein
MQDKHPYGGKGAVFSLDIPLIGCRLAVIRSEREFARSKRLDCALTDDSATRLHSYEPWLIDKAASQIVSKKAFIPV